MDALDLITHINYNGDKQVNYAYGRKQERTFRGLNYKTKEPPPCLPIVFIRVQEAYMEFTFETVYNQKAVTTMARTLRKTLRKKRSWRSHIFGWIVLVIAVLLTLPLGDREFIVNFKTIITWIAALAILAALLFEDRMNGYVARKRMLAGMDRATTVFNDESYVTTTSIGKTKFPYDRNIDLLAETKDYFVFVFDKIHAQVYDKHALSGGTLEEFRKFISEKTAKEITYVT